MTNQEKLATVQQEIATFRKANFTGQQWPIGKQAKLSDLTRQEKVLRTKIAIEWEASADLDNLGDPVLVPQQVFDLILRWFKSGLTRDEHLLLAGEDKDKAHLAAIKLTFDKPEAVLPV